jgi:hypothetical protein
MHRVRLVFGDLKHQPTRVNCLCDTLLTMPAPPTDTESSFDYEKQGNAGFAAGWYLVPCYLRPQVLPLLFRIIPRSARKYYIYALITLRR